MNKRNLGRWRYNGRLKHDYIRVKKGNKTAQRNILRMINKYGLNGWELFNRAVLETYTMYHFRRPSTTKKVK